MAQSTVSQVSVAVPVGNDISLRRSVTKRNIISFGNKSWASTLSFDLKSRNAQKNKPYIVCMSVQQASKSKIAVSPLELEIAKEPPLNTFKPKEPYTATIVSVERLVGPKAPGETCHIVIDHGGNVPYWEGQSYGVIPPGENPKKPGSPHNVRLYSIASSRYGDSFDGKTTSLCVRRAVYYNPETGKEDPSKSGVCSNFLCNCKPGDKVQITGPSGKIMLLPEDNPKANHIMIATGTGVAPFRGYLRRMFMEDVTFKFKGLAWLFLGVANKDSLLYDDEFTKYLEDYPDQFRYDLALSREQKNKSGGKMYVQDKIEEYSDEIFTTVLSQFLTLSNSTPRLSSSLFCGRLGSKYLKRPGSIRHNRTINGDNGAGFRCCCSVSLSQPAVPETSSIPVRKRIVSGVQPTGAIHLGNYLGAIKTWIELQNSYDTLFFIVDLHAITLPYDTQQLSKATRNTAAIYLACGVDTSKASVFVQSHVRAHVELMWLLSSATPIGWLNRMIQFKEKSRKAGDENVGVALLTYPVLMASDILLYQSDLVPVGEDQKQHLELTRELAERVNYLYGGRKWKKLGGRGGAIFKVPEPLIPPAGARVMSLTDGLSKMSKSAPSDQSRINLLDPKDVIANKIKRCKTDSFPGMEFDNPERPECNNLLSIYQLISGKTKEEVAQECQDMNWGRFKTLLTDALVDHLHPIQVRHEEIISDPAYLDGVLGEGATKAAAIADATLSNVYQAMGFLHR